MIEKEYFYSYLKNVDILWYYTKIWQVIVSQGLVAMCNLKPHLLH